MSILKIEPSAINTAADFSLGSLSVTGNINVGAATIAETDSGALAFTTTNGSFDITANTVNFLNTVATTEIAPGGLGAAGYVGSRGYTGSRGTDGIIGVDGYTGSAGVVGFTGSRGTNGTIGVDGYTGSRGETGAFGGASFQYAYNNDTTSTNPGSGEIEFNSTSFSASITAMFINFNDALGESIYSYLQTIDDSTSQIKGHFSVKEKANTDNFALFAITGTHAEEGTPTANHFHVPVTYLSGTPTFTDGMTVIVTFARTGDRGDRGFTGSASTVAGFTGSSGAGFTGSSGTGFTGSVGFTGSAGTAGAVGFTGSSAGGGGGGASNIPPNVQTSAYTLVLSDVGKYINITTGGVTVPSGVFASGDIVSVYNNSTSSQTITQGAGVTMYLVGTSGTGNRLLLQRGFATVMCVGTNEFVISGGGMT